MNYCAATLREPGEKLNNDGLMIKGIHSEKSTDVVVMVLSTDKKNAKLCDKIIRKAEKMIVTGNLVNAEILFESLFVKFGKKSVFFRKSMPDITVLVLKGINYFIMNRGTNQIFRVGRLAAEDITSSERFCEKGGYYYSEGRLPEGSTLIAGNRAFFEKQLGSDIHKRLCPQMCVDEDSMQSNIEYLWKQLWSRGEYRPITAAAVCVR